jgi:hypothetical protein
MKLLARSLFLPAAVAGLLSACGGGSVSVGEFDDDPWHFNEPRSSGRGAAVTVSAATDPGYDGVYSAADLWMTSVVRFFPSGGDPQTCRYRFASLNQQVSGREGRVMSGEVRYLPDSNDLRSTILAIDGLEFRADGTAGATVDRTANQVTYSNVVFRSTQGTGVSFTLTGGIPLRNEARPAGC